MKELKELGLNSYEQQIYLSLLHSEAIDAKEISKKSRVPFTAVYPNIYSLEDKGFVQIITGKKKLFCAIPPKIALNSFMERKQKQLLNLKSSAINQLQSYISPDTIKPKTIAHVSSGIEASKAFYVDSLKDASQTCYILGWRIYNTKDKYSYIKYFRDLLQKGVDIRILLIGDEIKKWGVISEYVKLGIQVKYYPLDNFSIFVVDDTKCKLTMKNAGYTDRTNVVIEDTDFALSMKQYFLSVWNKARKIDDMF